MPVSPQKRRQEIVDHLVGNCECDSKALFTEDDVEVLNKFSVEQLERLFEDHHHHHHHQIADQQPTDDPPSGLGQALRGPPGSAGTGRGRLLRFAVHEAAPLPRAAVPAAAKHTVLNS